MPVYEEGRYETYVEQLRNKRFVRAEEVLDLGHLASIPPGEFVGSGMWQLYKGIQSPYKSVLKLLLSEVYASEHPQVACLGLRFKAEVYAGRLRLEELDPYIMLYRRLEEYLSARGERERLELVRRSLYLKVGKKLSRPPRQGRKSWQRQVMERLTAEWHWDERMLGMLDARSQWKVRQVTQERRALVNELTYSYRFISRFARQQKADSGINPRDLGILGRRLYAAFERKAGKVELINPGIAPDLGEDSLTLARLPAASPGASPSWALFNGHRTLSELNDYAPFKRTRELIELLAWSHLNGVIDTGTRLSLQPGDSDLSDYELSNLLGSLQQAIALPLEEVPESALLRSSEVAHVLLLVNVGVDPLRQYSQANLHITSDRTDALGYSGVRDNLVLTIDQVSLNSWNELLVQSYTGPNALLDCLSDHLNALRSASAAPQLTVRCYCRNRAVAIAQRVDDLFRTAEAQLASGRHSRYLLQIRQGYHLLELGPEGVSHRNLEDLPTLLEYLGEAQPDYSELQLDRYALEGEDLGLLLPLGKPGCIQVFYRLDDGQADLYLLDERNSLWFRRQACDNEQMLLVPLQRFLTAVLLRRNAQLPLGGELPAPQHDVLYYEILPQGRQRAQRIERRPTPPIEHDQPYYNVQVILEPGDGQRLRATLYCNQREFSELEYGNGLLAAVARHILAQRRGQERYPCYITDLDLSALSSATSLQTLHYLRHKQKLENALNRALGSA
ncbi:MAG: Adenylate cyclase [Pseudomonas citronellolis]|nr:MAG: Adenylate cyclase [Pseudomonas citronellolis]